MYRVFNFGVLCTDVFVTEVSFFYTHLVSRRLVIKDANEHIRLLLEGFFFFPYCVYIDLLFLI